MKRLFFIVYNYLITPLALTVLFTIALPLNKKVRLGLQLRRNKKWPVHLHSPLWIHASSGEFEYAKPVIQQFKNDFPHIPVVVTYFSPSFAQTIEKFPGVDFAVPLPLDTPAATYSFIKKLNPRALLIARTDLWPQLLLTVNRLQIPALLFSSTFRALTGPRRFLKFYYKLLFDFFTEIYVVSLADKENIMTTNTKTPVQIMGDTRFDQVTYRLNHPKPFKKHMFSHVGPPILIAGSTWPQDEAILFTATLEMVQKKMLRLIVAPHEPTDDHINSLQNQLKLAGVSFSLYSETDSWTSQVLIVNQVGVLAELYTMGHIAMVGGSFKAKVHSVMEPLAAGLLTIVGPHHQNNREAIEFQKTKVYPLFPAVICATSPQEMQKIIEMWAQSLDQHQTISASIKNEVHRRTGASSHVLSWIKSHIKQ